MRRTAGVLAGISLVVCACSDRAAQPSTTPGREEAGPTAALTPPLVTATGGLPTNEQSPRATSDEADAAQAGPLTLLYYVLLAGESFESIHDAVERSVADCMVDRGWAYEPVPYHAIEQSPDYSGAWQAVVAYREEFGYGINQQPSARLTNPNDAQVDALSSSARSAYFGDLVGGTEGSGLDPDSCTAKAQQTVLDSIPYYQPQYARVPADYLDRLESAPEYQAAVAAWSDCMEQSGYVVEHPDQMTELARTSWTSGSAQDLSDELAAAAADVACYEEFVLEPRRVVDAAILQDIVDSGLLPSALWNDEVRAALDTP